MGILIFKGFVWRELNCMLVIKLKQGYQYRIVEQDWIKIVSSCRNRFAGDNDENVLIVVNGQE